MTHQYPIALALGGNIGDVAATFRAVATALEKSGISHLKCSSAYQTAPVGCAPGTPDFLNAALIGTWGGSVAGLHALCKSMEEQFGRPRDHESNVSRTLDLDIIFFGNAIINTPELTIPHKEAARRLFVLLPLAEIAADWDYPGIGCSVGEMLEKLRHTPDYPQIAASRQPL